MLDVKHAVKQYLELERKLRYYEFAEGEDWHKERAQRILARTEYQLFLDQFTDEERKELLDAVQRTESEKASS